MRFYYYISLSHNLLHNHPDVRQSELCSYYTLLEWLREAEPDEIDKYRLVYIGCGYKSDRHIQEHLERCKR